MTIAVKTVKTVATVAAWIPFRGSEQEHILLDILCLASQTMQEQ